MRSVLILTFCPILSLSLSSCSTPCVLLSFLYCCPRAHRHLHSFPTRRSSDLSLRRFGPLEDRLAVEALRELAGEPAHADRFRTAYIERRTRHRAMTQRAQHHGVGIALPDHVQIGRAHV